MDPQTLKARFDAGIDFSTFKAQAQRHQELFEDLYETLRIPSEIANAFSERVRRHGGHVHALALAEDWCGDAARALPLLARVCEAAPGMHLRILHSDAQENQTLVKHWPKGERNAIPIIVFFNGQFDEIGHWIERSQAGDVFRQQLREELKHLSQVEFSKIARPRLAQEFKNRLWRETLNEWQAALSVKSPQVA